MVEDKHIIEIPNDKGLLSDEYVLIKNRMYEINLNDILKTSVTMFESEYKRFKIVEN